MSEDDKEIRKAFEEYRNFEEVSEFFLTLSRDEYLRAKSEGDNEEVAMMDSAGVHAFYHGWLACQKQNNWISVNDRLPESPL